METSWDRLKRQLEDFYQTAADKTDELARVGARRIDVMSLRRQFSREMLSLGSRVYEMLTKENAGNVAEDPEVRRRLEAAKSLEEEISRRETEISEIRTAAAERRAGQTSSRRGPGKSSSEPGPSL